MAFLDECEPSEAPNLGVQPMIQTQDQVALLSILAWCEAQKTSDVRPNFSVTLCRDHVRVSLYLHGLTDEVGLVVCGAGHQETLHESFLEAVKEVEERIFAGYERERAAIDDVAPTLSVVRDCTEAERA